MLSERGYMVTSGPFEGADLTAIMSALECAVAEALPHQIKRGSSGTNVRVDGLLPKAPRLEALFTHPPVLVAAKGLTGVFRLSSFHVRTVLPGSSAQLLHQDVRPHADGWPLLGFIFMVDDFTPENGATRFVPGSQELEDMPEELLRSHPYEEHACGPAGSMILFNGSVWHGFGANLSGKPRRSVQGSLIPQNATAAVDYERTLPAAVWKKFSDAGRAILRGSL